MANKSWKDWEREVASWFGGRRNPLSGRNNVSDSGEKRLGDVVGVGDLVVECKLLKAVASIRRARQTAKLAKENGKRFVHVEREKGDRKLVCFVVDRETAKEIVKFLSTGGRQDGY